jgi:hypothetical protein
VCGDDYDCIDITGDPELETAYRERIPVVELDGEAVFTYFVNEESLRTAIEGFV